MKRRRIPHWVEGGVFMLFLVPLIFFLKIICPINTGCLADPFVVAIFSPLLLFAYIGIPTETLGIWEPLFIVGFWVFIGCVCGYLVGVLKEGSRDPFADPENEDGEETS